MTLAPWLFWAALSAVFATLMTIWAKAGLRGIDPDSAQLIRTAVIFPTLTVFVLLIGKWLTWPDGASEPGTFSYFRVSQPAHPGSGYFRAFNVGESSCVAAIDKLNFVIVALIGNDLATRAP
jgi:bacterial/archaeal transporter family protein